jgi:hypothetical protein
MRNLVLSGALSIAACAPVFAQNRVYVAINAAAQAGSKSLSDRFEFEENAERGTAEIRSPGTIAIVFEGGAGIRVWKKIGAGVAVSRATRNDAVHVEAAIPHPFVFGQQRQVEGDFGRVTREETSVHLQLLYMIERSRRLRLVLSAGPSLINVAQEVVNRVQYDETFPFDAATFRSATTVRAKDSVTGFNAGADVMWMFARKIGVGGGLRFARGRVGLTAPIAGPGGTSFTNPPTSRQLRLDAGGVQAGAGIRVLF